MGVFLAKQLIKDKKENIPNIIIPQTIVSTIPK